MSSGTGALIPRALVLDANILIRALLGRKVVSLLEAYSNTIDFVTPAPAYSEVAVHLPPILARRGFPASEVELLLEEQAFGRLPGLVTPVPHEVYSDLERDARLRLRGRDEQDWPVIALALRLGCPIWTEDRDFFGTGVPVWTTDRVELYLSSDPGP